MNLRTFILIWERYPDNGYVLLVTARVVGRRTAHTRELLEELVRHRRTKLGLVLVQSRANAATVFNLLNQYSPVPRARSLIAGKDATRPVGARVARAQIYAGLGTVFYKDHYRNSIIRKKSVVLLEHNHVPGGPLLIFSN